MDTSEREFCQCGKPEKWARHPAFPVEFDAELNEYYMVHGKKQPRNHIMRYCFWCGGRLPESKRGELFTEPDEGEMAEVRTLLAEARSAADALRVLGEPDNTVDWVEGPEPELYASKKWTKCHQYSSRWKTLVVNVLEFSDGSYSLAVPGQFVGASNKCRCANEPGNKPWWKFWG